MFRIFLPLGIACTLPLFNLYAQTRGDGDDLAKVVIPDEAKEVDVGTRRLGNVTQKFEYRLDGELVGVRLFYENEKLAEEKIYRNGKLHGYWTQYYESGLLFAERPYREGKPDGVFRFYDENGQLLGKSTLRDGTGTLREFEYTQLASHDATIPYRDGKIEGNKRVWGRYGRCLLSGIREETVNGVDIQKYQNDRPSGWGTTYDEEGNLFASAYMLNGKLQGVFRKYDKEGRPVRGWPKYYIQSKEVSRESYLQAAQNDPVLKISLDKDRPDEPPDLKRPE